MFSLILVGELLSFAFVVIDHGFSHFQWFHFGSVSFLVQWIILSSAACLCPLRPWFKEQNGVVAGSVSYGIVLLMTLLFTLFGQWLSSRQLFQNSTTLLENMAIAAIFAGVVLRYFYLQQQLHNREQAELQSRIQALQSRIRPHFLFNSMNSIASLIDIDPKAAEKMVVDLSQLFRSSLSESAMVPLEEEIRLCQQFVSIEQTRLGSRVKVNWQVNLKQDNPEIPSLLLQPLIENAIYHGIQPLPDGGVVDVEVTVITNRVHLLVKNPFSDNETEKRKKNNGMALENIRHRLHAHFGDDATMVCQQSNNEFIVEITYPTNSERE